MTKSRTNGFTLIELLTVIAIIGIIVALALPALRAIQSTALQTAVRQVSNAIQLTRQYAITKRSTTRFVIAVDTSSGAISPDLVCRAYTVCQAVRDDDGTLLYWLPLQDWSFLPDGVVFSDLNAENYGIANLSPNNVPPPLGTSTRTLSDSSAFPRWQYFNNPATGASAMSVTNLTGVGAPTVSWNASYIEFKPTGMGAGLCAVRLMQGSVSDPSPPPRLTLLITDTNNWAFVESDPYGGRVRVRYRDYFR